MSAYTVSIKREYKLRCRACEFAKNIMGSVAAEKEAAKHVHIYDSQGSDHEVEITEATVIGR